jgi:NAD-dependent deacetylase
MPSAPPAARPPKLIVFSGAGISAESGLQTFRGSGGLWENHDLNEVCNYQTWKANAALVHRFYNERRTQLRSAEPNSAHTRIAQWQLAGHADVITANVDDLLERAGCGDVLHVHGRLTGMLCTACGNRWDVGYAPWDPATDRCTRERCASRKGVKPDVVFFGEIAPAYADMYRAFGSLRPGDAVLAIGTSLAVVRVHEMLREAAPGVTAILNVLNLEDIQADAVSVGRAFRHILVSPASEAVKRVEEILPWLQTGAAVDFQRTGT